MAAPFVAAEAALIHARFPTLRNKDIVDQIERTATSIGGPVDKRIDVGRALSTLPESASSPTPTPMPGAKRKRSD